MVEVNKLSDLKYYANFETFEYKGKTIVLYDDHRCILTVLYEARKQSLTDCGTNLVTFDKHDDALPIKQEELKRKIDSLVKEGIKNVSQRSFKNFVEFDIREYDDDWVCVGMELGLIKDIVNIGCDDNININIRDWPCHTYKDRSGNAHSGLVISHIEDAFSPNGGALGDKARYEDFKIVRDMLGYNLPGEGECFAERDTDFVLDFDLDCFTTKCQGERYAWPESIFNVLYGNGNNKVKWFMDRIIQKAKFVTICREPSYCGGIGESNKILGYLDKYFFEGCLGTDVVK
ncbi:MAG: UPF0489 family protein [Prevotella sp.]|nr:UPF0489 family protein [Prevotella sp.]